MTLNVDFFTWILYHQLYLSFCIFLAQQPPVRQSLLIIKASRSHSDTPHSVELLWTSDQPDAETSTWQHTTLTRDRCPCPRRDSKPQSHKAKGRRSRPQNVPSLESALSEFTVKKFWFLSFPETGFTVDYECVPWTPKIAIKIPIRCAFSSERGLYQAAVCVYSGLLRHILFLL